MRNIINFRDIIKDLSQRGLNIVDKSVLAYYIKNFNHNTFIEGYSVPFYETDNKYDQKASSDQLISLFKFDSDMANHILRFILVVEKIMNTNITYGIINEYGIRDKCLFKLDRRFIEHNVMPNINDILPRTNYDHLSLKLVKYLSTNIMTKKYSDRNSKDEIHRWRTCPLDLMCLTWSFATTFSLFVALENNVRKRIIENFGISENHESGFIDFMKNVLFLRNMISHNNIIFSFVPPQQTKAIYDMYESIFHKKIHHLSLINLMELIEFFSHSKTLVSNTRYYFNKLKIEEKFKKKIGLFYE